MNTPLPENTWHGFSLDTLFNTGITIFIFVAGYVANRIYERYKRKRDLDTLKKYFVYVANHIDEPVKKQVTYFSEFSNALRLKNRANRSFHLGHSPVSALENVKKIKHTDLYDIYMKCKPKEVDKRAKDLQQFHESIFLIDHIYKTYIEKHERFSKNLTEYEKQWNENTSAILRYYDKEASKAVKNSLIGGKDLFIEAISSLLQSYTAHPEYTQPSVAMNGFIEPLYELCKKQVADDRAPVFIKYTIECRGIHQNMENLHKTYRLYFITVGRKMNQARLDLQESLKTIKESNKKRVFRKKTKLEKSAKNAPTS